MERFKYKKQSFKDVSILRKTYVQKLKGKKTKYKKWKH